MQDFILDAVQWLVWCVVLIKHWYNNSKWKQNDSSSVDQQSRQKRKAMASLSLKRLTALDSIFILQILQNPNIQNPSHPDLIKFRLRFRVSYSVFAAIVHMFITKQCPNKILTKMLYSSMKSHSTLQRLLLIERSWVVNRWLCCRCPFHSLVLCPSWATS